NRAIGQKNSLRFASAIFYKIIFPSDVFYCVCIIKKLRFPVKAFKKAMPFQHKYFSSTFYKNLCVSCLRGAKLIVLRVQPINSQGPYS
ncbi:MAG: hypothetical protein Q4G07_08580, partial [Oscillospiraceae bacterium]|nr:hypothetical protein [Oscillospiraceae bacterium]